MADTEGSTTTGRDNPPPPFEITPQDRVIGELMAARAIMSAIEQYSKRLAKMVQIAPRLSTAAGLLAAQQAFVIASRSADRWGQQARARFENEESKEMIELGKRMENALEGLTDLYLDDPEGRPEAQ